MKFGYTIVYVSSVTETLSFYKEAFGFETRFLHESDQYGELETGATVLAFASHAMGEMNLDGNYQKTDPGTAPLGVELASVADDVPASFTKAVSAGVSAYPDTQPRQWRLLPDRPGAAHPPDTTEALLPVLHQRTGPHTG